MENYPLFPKDISYEEELGWIIERTKLEVQMQEGNCFSPWDASDEYVMTDKKNNFILLLFNSFNAMYITIY